MNRHLLITLFIATPTLFEAQNYYSEDTESLQLSPKNHIKWRSIIQQNNNHKNH